MTRDLVLRDYIQAGSFLVGGFLLGFIAFLVVRRRYKKHTTMSSWGGDDIIVGAIHDVLLVWFGVAGAFGALRSLPVKRSIGEPIEKALLAIVILSATVVVARVVADLTKLYALRSGGGLRGSSIFVTLARLTAFIIGVLILLQTLGVSITPLLTALGIGGLAVALAMQDTLANLFSGIHLIASRKIRIGDYIKLDGGQEGYVTDINWRNTTIRNLPNNQIIVPNAKMASAIVTNYARPMNEMSVFVQVGVAYTSDLEHVERVTVEVAREALAATPGGVDEWEPAVRFHTFNDFSIDCTVVLRVNEFSEQHLVKHEFVKRLHRRFAEEGIEIPFPIRTLEFRDPEGAPDGKAKLKAPPARRRRTTRS